MSIRKNSKIVILTYVQNCGYSEFNKCFLALRQNVLYCLMFLMAAGSWLNIDAAEYWKVPDSLGIEKIGAMDDLRV